MSRLSDAKDEFFLGARDTANTRLSGARHGGIRASKPSAPAISRLQWLPAMPPWLHPALGIHARIRVSVSMRIHASCCGYNKSHICRDIARGSALSHRRWGRSHRRWGSSHGARAPASRGSLKAHLGGLASACRVSMLYAQRRRASLVKRRQPASTARARSRLFRMRAPRGARRRPPSNEPQGGERPGPSRCPHPKQP